MKHKTSLERCIDCGNSCCRYFTVQIPTPRSIADFDCLLWQLSHEHVKIFKDSTGWHLLIYTPCVHLSGNGKCTIYQNRPLTCREHPAEECEFDTPIRDSVMLFFENHQSLEKYCRKRFKNWSKRFG